MLAGLAGCLTAHSNFFIGPNEFGFDPAVTILTFALLGGIGTPIGSGARRPGPDLLPEVAARASATSGWWSTALILVRGGPVPAERPVIRRFRLTGRGAA